MTEPVQGVQQVSVPSYREWKKANPEGTRKEYKLFKSELKEKQKGVEIEQSGDQPLTVDMKRRKEKKYNERLKDIAEMKEYAKTQKADKAGVGENLKLSVDDELSPDNKTLIGNDKEFKDELLRMHLEGELPSDEELIKEYGSLAEDVKSIYGLLEYRKQHYQSHDLYLDKKEYKSDMREQKQDGVERKEFKENNTLVKNRKVKEFIEKNFTDKDGKVDAQALKNYVAQFIGTDYQLNYGVHKQHKGGTGQDEIRILKDETGLSTRQVKKLVKAAGGFTEKDDSAWKIPLAGAGGAAVGSAIGAIGGASTKLNGTAEANATAQVVDVLGNVLSEAADRSVADAVKDLLGHGMALGSVVGGVVALGATAITYKYDGKRDVMNGYSVEQAVANPDLMLKGLKKPSATDKIPWVMVETLKDAGVPEKEIIDAIKLAKGNASGNNVNINEMISACKMLEDKYKANEVVQPKTETVTPEVTATPTQKNIAEEVQIERYHYDRKPGEYWFGIVKNMYESEDGKPISNVDASKQASALKKAYGIAAKSADMPNALDLDLTIDIDGKKYKLKNVDPSKIQRTISTEASDGKTIKAERNDKTKKEDVTYYGYEAAATVEGEIKEQRIVAPETKKYKEAQARNEAMEQAKKELKESHPPFEREVE